MNLILIFSGRENGNCHNIASAIAADGDAVVAFRDLDVHACSGCQYECFRGPCKYRRDDAYGLYESMTGYDKIFFLVPMYCGNPSSLYFKFQQRGQDFFTHNEACYEAIVSRLYIIGIYGSQAASPDFIPGLESWFAGTGYRNRVLGLQRHLYGQKISDDLLQVPEVRSMLRDFIGQPKP